MSQIGLSSQSVGAEEVKNVLNGIVVQTAPASKNGRRSN
ncbi:Putative protein [Zobellia galactanivorans]|uniref:Uncharacterized protein n=1 Tax=Zobellia galactanivorans (strain DSM 12802 / CCUG 47099 / CIP 106680 / NCIMB 13871 / Dsij) TaxID=63186 RepID=G0L0W1_ZOBGA|nr:Putative protein [Zobellia galactanivorans]